MDNCKHSGRYILLSAVLNRSWIKSLISCISWIKYQTQDNAVVQRYCELNQAHAAATQPLQVSDGIYRLWDGLCLSCDSEWVGTSNCEVAAFMFGSGQQPRPLTTGRCWPRPLLNVKVVRLHWDIQTVWSNSTGDISLVFTSHPSQYRWWLNILKSFSFNKTSSFFTLLLHAPKGHCQHIVGQLCWEMGSGHLSDMKRATGGSNLCLTGCDISHPKTTTLHFSNALKSAESSSHSSASEFPWQESGFKSEWVWHFHHAPSREATSVCLRPLSSPESLCLFPNYLFKQRNPEGGVCVCGGWGEEGIESFCYHRVVQLSTELLCGAAARLQVGGGRHSWTTKTSGTCHCYSQL